MALGNNFFQAKAERLEMTEARRKQNKSILSCARFNT